MPNTPCSIGEGISAYCLGAYATPDDAALVRRILAAAGEVVEVKETQMDGETAAHQPWHGGSTAGGDHPT